MVHTIPQDLKNQHHPGIANIIIITSTIFIIYSSGTPHNHQLMELSELF